MDDPVSPAAAQSSAARAFDDLRGEVSLLRRAIEGLTAERRDQPDYGPTLEVLATSNDEIRAWARKINERPAMRLTPTMLTCEIERASAEVRSSEAEALKHARSDLNSAARAISSALCCALSDEQRRVRLLVSNIVMLLAGLLIGIILV